jgi:hypothetical protein
MALCKRVWKTVLCTVCVLRHCCLPALGVGVGSGMSPCTTRLHYILFDNVSLVYREAALRSDVQEPSPPARPQTPPPASDFHAVSAPELVERGDEGETTFAHLVMPSAPPMEDESLYPSPVAVRYLRLHGATCSFFGYVVQFTQSFSVVPLSLPNIY